MRRCTSILALLLSSSAPLFGGAVLSGCSLWSGPPPWERPEPADRAAFVKLLAFPQAPLPAAVTLGESRKVSGGMLSAARIAWFPGFDVHGALLRPDAPTGAGVVVAQGHFGEGKSSPEAQEIALRLVERGAVVVMVDTPGMEEADRPGRHIHFDSGAHNRALLSAGGASAMGLQVSQLKRAVDLLQAEGATRIGATGASGGAVQSLYLGLADERVQAIALASYVPTPREARAGGCPCDQVPGWPGPDPTVSLALQIPSLWLTDGPAERPHLPDGADWYATDGPHSYTPQMQARALDFFADKLGLRSLRGDGPEGLTPAPIQPIRTPALTETDADIPDLATYLQPKKQWSAGRTGEGHHELSCQGKGPVVVVAGGEETDLSALEAAGLRACAVRIPEDAVGHDEAVGTAGTPYTHILSGALHAAADRVQAKAVFSVRGHGLVAAGTGLPYVVRDPIRGLAELDPNQDANWVHVPGAWWGALDPVWQGALATGDDPVELAGRLAKELRPDVP